MLFPAKIKVPFPDFFNPPKPVILFSNVEVILSLTLALNCPLNPAFAALSPTSSSLLNLAGPFNAFSSFKRPHPNISSTPGCPKSVAVVNIVCCISCPVIQGNFSFNLAAAADTFGVAKDEPYSVHPGNPHSPFVATVHHIALPALAK